MPVGTALPADACDPRQCELGRQPHAHCTCGLPRSLDATCCPLCGLEELAPVVIASAARDCDPEAWDGRSYPSRRQHRLASATIEAYEQLLVAVLRHEESKQRPRLGRSAVPSRNAAVLQPRHDAAAHIARQLAGSRGERVIGESRGAP